MPKHTKIDLMKLINNPKSMIAKTNQYKAYHE
jgi:hypothetical protein